MTVSCKLVDVPTSICFNVAVVNVSVYIHELDCGIHFPGYVTLDSMFSVIKLSYHNKKPWSIEVTLLKSTVQR